MDVGENGDRRIPEHLSPTFLQRYPCIHFLLAIYCWLCRLLLRVVCFLSETSLDKTKFVLANGVFIHWRLFWLSNGDTSPFSSKVPSSAEPCRSCAYCFSLCDFLWAFHIDLEAFVFSIQPPLTPSAFSSPGRPREGLDDDIPFKSGYSNVSLSVKCHLCISVFVPICYMWLSKTVINFLFNIIFQNFTSHSCIYIYINYTYTHIYIYDPPSCFPTFQPSLPPNLIISILKYAFFQRIKLVLPIFS